MHIQRCIVILISIVISKRCKSEIVKPLSLPQLKESIRISALENATSVFAHNKTVVCYAIVESQCRVGNDWTQFRVAMSPPKLYTHLLLGFAQVQFKRGGYQPTADCFLGQRNLTHVLAKLRENNPHLKILLSVGEPLQGGSVISQLYKMAEDPAHRKVFIERAVKLLKAKTMDGLDIYFPGNRDPLHDKEPTTGVVQLFAEIQQELDKHGFLFTAAFGPLAITAERAVVTQIAKVLDLVQVIAYDYHLFGPKVTGHAAPLPKVITSLVEYVEKGVPEDKLVLGIQTFGRSFLMSNGYGNLYPGTALGVPLEGDGMSSYGIEWEDQGFKTFESIVGEIEQEEPMANLNGFWDEEAQVPFINWGWLWQTFENGKSIARKAAVVRLTGIRGAMVFALESDCNPGRILFRPYATTPSPPHFKYPLLKKLNYELSRGQAFNE